MRNVHERHVRAPLEQVGALLETLGSDGDRLWPVRTWAPMVLDRGLDPGSRGGHHRIHYAVTAHEAGHRVAFAFDRSTGLDGTHAFSLEARGVGSTVLRHELEGRTRGAMVLLWPLAVRWAHDALVEDAFDQAERALGTGPERPARWSPWVRLLRGASSAGTRRRCVRQVETPAELLAAAALSRVDFTDTFELRLPPGSSREVDDWHRALVTAGAPAWVAALMAVRNRVAQGLGLRTAGRAGPPSTPLSSDGGTLVVGADDGHLDFRVVLRVHGDHLQLATVVHLHGTTGRAYFALVKPFHRRIVPALLRRTGRLAPPGRRASAPAPR